MNVKRINYPDTHQISVDEWLKLLFEETSNSAMVDIPVFYGVDSNDFYRCQIDWDIKKYETILEKYRMHYANIKKIALFLDGLQNMDKSSKQILDNEDLARFWDTYIRPFDSSGFDMERISHINEHIEAGENISEEDNNYHKLYVESVYSDVEKRIGKRYCSYELIMRSVRLCQLMSVGAPEIIILNETRELATAMLIYEYGVSCERVNEN